MSTCIHKLWSTKLSDSVNCLTVGKPFLKDSSEENDILIGTTAGRVLILNQTKAVECLLETKGGSIQAIRLHDLTGYGTLDLAVGDCDGVVTLFSKQKILSKREVGSAITDIVIDNDLVGGCEIIAGDMSGMISSFQQHDALWKINIAEESSKLALLGTKGRRSPSIRCMLATVLKDRFNLDMACLLVCDGWPFVHFIQHGERTMSLRTPTVIQSICSGNFIDSNSLRKFQPGEKSRISQEKLNDPQVLLAGKDGYVYIMINFEIFQWIKVGFIITNILRWRPSNIKEEETDLLVCTGHSNEVLVFQNGEKVSVISTSDWPHAVTLGDVNADGRDELILGLLNQTIDVYEYRQQ
ncbi:hypothetical protein CU098_012765 [Rhizopus stolonifer]|uniref:Uncharacterized protein n=1 Tax=Rhizopus stolonifer TaxID=4846 RepID=A0A367KU73_RHIST|nr:hypothetical protein CU098_012765 [Rhizopus stolonifer]